MRLQGRVAIVTGSGRGLGKAMAVRLAREGARVMVTDVNETAMEETVALIRSGGASTLAVRCDVTDPGQVQAMVAACVNEFGQIDILVNNAGDGRFDGGNRFLEGLSVKDLDYTINLNLKGTLLCTMTVMPHMIARRYGKIVNISSQGGRYSSEFAGPYYSAAKAGQLGFTRQMALKLGPYGIYVNAIAPGVIFSGQTEESWPAAAEDVRREMVSKIPLRRLGTAEELASVVVFLASDESSYITGATLDVNGGRFMS
jgi:NAD(P)-dependent dehydrogenase (short-subunit alcohol dehydrogenase family)